MIYEGASNDLGKLDHPNGASHRIRCRQINSSDFEGVANLLAAGFRRHDRRYWLDVLQYLGDRKAPDGFPRYGYMLASGTRVVGVLLLIFATLQNRVRCNLSSWYVEQDFRALAPLLVSPVLKCKQVTFLNIWPATNTWSTIEAMGFDRLSGGVFLCAPALSARSIGAKIVLIGDSVRPEGYVPQCEVELLQDHERRGCLSILCHTREDVYPFIFRRRLIRHGFKYSLIPCAQLIYCRDLEGFGRLAGPIGRFLAIRGMPLVLVGANAAIPNVIGKYFDNKSPVYYKGPDRPDLGDLLYTDVALFGV